jgi:AraC-like DNA-binding protein
MSRQDARTSLRRETATDLTTRRQGGLQPVAASPSARRFAYPAARIMPIALTPALADYAVEPLDAVHSAPGLEAVIPLGEPCHYRVRTGEPYGTGQVEFCGLADGFFIHMGDIQYGDACLMSVTAPDMLRIRIASDGDGEYVPARAEAMDIGGPCAAIIIEPAGQPPAEAAFVGRNRAVHVYVHRETLRQVFAGGEQELPAVLQAFLDGALQRTVARRLAFGPALLRCLEDLHGCKLEGHRRRLFIRAKAVEILCHTFEALDEEDSAGCPASSAQMARGVVKAQRLLMDNFVSPPSLDDLAHAVGMSRSSLCSGFRQILGQSVYDYIQDLRMQHALALLAERDASITQIAYAVGYNYPSSFSVAVQRHFGATPKELRRRGALPTTM